MTRPTYEGRKGHPVCVSRDVIAQLQAQPVKAEAREVIRSFRHQTFEGQRGINANAVAGAQRSLHRGLEHSLGVRKPSAPR